MKSNIKLLLLTMPAAVLSGGWTWMSGSQYIEPSGDIGTPLVESPRNHPTSIYAGTCAYDQDSRLMYYLGTWNYGTKWQFWRYNASSLMWAFVEGDITGRSPVFGTLGEFAPNNGPKANSGGYLGVVDDERMLLFGGASRNNADRYAIMWLFNTTSGQWARIAGNTTVNVRGTYGTLNVPSTTVNPGARYFGGGFFDKPTNLMYIFAGTGYNSGTTRRYLNDMWTFNINTYEFTWIGGVRTGNAASVYGDLAVYSNTSWPGSRASYGYTYSPQAKSFFLFGGYGFAQDLSDGYLADFWQYSLELQQWRWLGGQIEIDKTSNFGTFGIAAPENAPASREVSFVGFDPVRNLAYIQGGYAWDATVGDKYLNDFWEFDLGTLMFRWIGGRQRPNSPGRYGLGRVEDASNIPGARSHGAHFFDEKSREFFIAGGFGSDIVGNVGYLNDVWRFKAAVPQPNVTTTAIPETTVQYRQGEARSPVPVDNSITNNPAFLIGVSVGGAALLIIVGIILIRRAGRPKLLPQHTALNPTMTSPMFLNQSVMLPPGATQMQLQTSVVGPAVLPPPAWINMGAPGTTPEHLRCDKNAFEIANDLRKEKNFSVKTAWASNDAMKAYGAKVHVKIFGEHVEKLSELQRIAFFQEIAILWALRVDNAAAKLLSFCLEPASIITCDYEHGGLETFLSSNQALSKRNMLTMLHDVARVLNVMHSFNHAHRSLQVKNLFIEKEGQKLNAVINDFSSALPVAMENIAQTQYANVDIGAAFAPPELLNAINGNKPTEKFGQLVKAADVYAFGSVLYSLLMRNKWSF